MFSGCLNRSAEPPLEVRLMSSETVFIHTVSIKGESLGAIASWYTGAMKNWLKLKDYNCEAGKGYLKIGTKIRIPDALMTRRVEFDESYIKEWNAEIQKRIVATKRKVKPQPTPVPTPIVNLPVPLEQGPTLEDYMDSLGQEDLDKNQQDKVEEGMKDKVIESLITE